MIMGGGNAFHKVSAGHTYEAVVGEWLESNGSVESLVHFGADCNGSVWWYNGTNIIIIIMWVGHSAIINGRFWWT